MFFNMFLLYLKGYSETLRAKTYRYLKCNNDKDKKAEGTEKCIIKRKLKFENYKNCLEAAQIEKKYKPFRKK